MPSSTHAWPKRAACWSPATPATGASWPYNASGLVIPSVPALAATRGNAHSGTSSSASSSGSQRPAPMSHSIVRDAFDGSVRCSPVSLKINHESIVPNTAPPVRARSRSPSTLRNSHSILVAEKYGSSTSPVRSRTSRS